MLSEEPNLICAPEGTPIILPIQIKRKALKVEPFFGLITDQRIRRGVFKSVAELESAIMDYLDQHNAQPKPFVWTKSAGEILEKVARAKQPSESQH